MIRDAYHARTLLHEVFGLERLPVLPRGQLLASLVRRSVVYDREFLPCGLVDLSPSIVRASLIRVAHQTGDDFELSLVRWNAVEVTPTR